MFSKALDERIISNINANVCRMVKCWWHSLMVGHERHAEKLGFNGATNAGLCCAPSANSSWKNHCSFREAALCKLLAIFQGLFCGKA